MVYINQVHIYIYISYLRSWTVNFECQMKKEHNYFDDSALAIVFPRAKHAGSAVLKIFFWTTDILFNIDSALMITGFFLNLAENWFPSLNGLKELLWKSDTSRFLGCIVIDISWLVECLDYKYTFGLQAGILMKHTYSDRLFLLALRPRGLRCQQFTCITIFNLKIANPIFLGHLVYIYIYIYINICMYLGIYV